MNTFVIERRGDDTWLCASDGSLLVYLAKFNVEASVITFQETLEEARLLAHEKGTQGL